MKFIYQYRTSDNIQHTDVVVASDREDAFRRLKSRGIRPGKLTEASGILNHVLGKGKRWCAIAGLTLVLLVILVGYFRAKIGERYAYEERAQIFGDPSDVQRLSRNGWGDTFPDCGEAWLARHAIPGRLCVCSTNVVARGVVAKALYEKMRRPVAILDTEPDELKKMKRMVNCMKRELSEYALCYDDVLAYMDKACERLVVEHGIYENMERELEAWRKRMLMGTCDRRRVMEEWDKRNAMLRAMGLSTIVRPE